MKNRLEVAKELLSDEGSIFVQIDWQILVCREVRQIKRVASVFIF